jgi:hypothetical protein
MVTRWDQAAIFWIIWSMAGGSQGYPMSRGIPHVAGTPSWLGEFLPFLLARKGQGADLCVETCMAGTVVACVAAFQKACIAQGTPYT